MIILRWFIFGSVYSRSALLCCGKECKKKILILSGSARSKIKIKTYYLEYRACYMKNYFLVGFSREKLPLKLTLWQNFLQGLWQLFVPILFFSPATMFNIMIFFPFSSLFWVNKLTGRRTFFCFNESRTHRQYT